LPKVGAPNIFLCRKSNFSPKNYFLQNHPNGQELTFSPTAYCEVSKVATISFLLFFFRI
jgi:hypothetical protein